MITTNLDFAEWSSVFVDAKMTTAPCSTGSRTTATSWRPATRATASCTATAVAKKRIKARENAAQGHRSNSLRRRRRPDRAAAPGKPLRATPFAASPALQHHIEEPIEHRQAPTLIHSRRSRVRLPPLAQYWDGAVAQSSIGADTWGTRPRVAAWRAVDEQDS